jgi:hypothetical protein
MKFIIQMPDLAPAPLDPTEDHWYAGITARGETGVIAQYRSGAFVSSEGEHSMNHYAHLEDMTAKRTQEVRVRNISQALSWLETLIDSPAVPWEPKQKIAAREALLAAKASI